ncbi:MATE family efflux transporter [Marinisporobacter balticus]|uniref:Multidrug export protein MepA n=1 Tax=Marinisporobacter balticus TaxID=2018667 RepID=A0A4R2K878_9FIRM|nr:MATE family efflux transporter [Marinisporobacter balticus]TCO68272.1 putative MATE family efflux protein [Marinisporobacter balticus]
MNERIRIMSEESIPTALLKFGIPAIIGFLITAIYNFVDAIFVGRLGTSAMGALAVAFPISMISIGIGLILGSGAASYISRLLGEGEIKQANVASSIAFFGSLILGIIAIIPSLIFLKPILRFFGATETILPFAKAYMYIFIPGSLFNVINIALNHLARAEGAAKTSMNTLLIGAILNIILDPIFIYTFHLGISGAAIATVISQILSTILLLRFFYSDKSSIKLSIKYFTLSKKVLFEIIKIGIPNLVTQILSGVSMGLINSAAFPYGDTAVAAMGIVNRIFAIGSYVILGFSKGFQPIAGYNYGAKKYIRLKKSINVSLKWTTCLCFILAIIQIIFASPIVSIFTNESRVLDIGVQALRAYSIVFPVFGFQTIYMSLFLALGKGREGLVLSLGRQGVFLIPIVLILPQIIGLNGVILSQPIADLLTVLLTIFFNIKLKKDMLVMESI